MTSDPIVVTGLGATTPLAGTATQSWQQLLAGASGIGSVPAEWTVELPVRIAGVAAQDPSEVLDRVQARRWDRSQQLAIVAAREAWSDAGHDDSLDNDRLAVVFGSGIGGVETLLTAQETLTARGANRVSPMAVPMLMPNGPAAAVGLEFGARAGVHTPISACASGAEAVAQALDLLRLGRADVVIAGGAEAGVLPVTMAGFAAMRALSTRNDSPTEASRPYDKARDGFVLAEGAGALVLERLSHAKARRATVYATLAGAAVTSDAYHVAAPDPQGQGASRAITNALREADLSPADVSHVNAHATSTPVGDLAETVALHRALGADLGGVAVSATKSATGHMLGAAGAVEAVFTVQALHYRQAPPTRNLDSQDDEIDLNVVRIEPAPLANNTCAISTSFGFGGHNVALAFTGA